MYFNNLNWLLSFLYPALLWKKPAGGKTIYLTFDDGPIPGVTEYVLDELDRFGVKATFFCVGENIRKHPEVLKKVLSKGHKAANHTYNHFNGWKTEDQIYFKNIEDCEFELQRVKREMGLSAEKDLFRPPYGKIKKSQIKHLKNSYKIVMWDVLTGDFNKDLSEEKCLAKSINYTVDGSIVIFHDSIKAEKNLRYALPRFLEHFISMGYKFRVL